MNKEFIPFRQALDLKELGFDESCFTRFENYFDKSKLYPILATLCLNTPYENEYHDYDQKIINDTSKNWNFTGYKNSVKNHNDDILSAPTFSQAFKFFREKHNLRSFVDTRVYNVDSPNQWIYDYQIKMGNGIDTKPYYSGDFDTYEEAELACLIKLIEIVKNKEK